MTRRRRLLAAATALAVLPVSAYAQRRLWRIGYHSGSNADSNASYLAAFRKGMAELGWSESEHYVIDARYADGSVVSFERIATELVATKPDVILTVADEPLLARVTKTIPIVFALGADPIGNGYAKSLQRPGG